MANNGVPECLKDSLQQHLLDGSVSEHLVGCSSGFLYYLSIVALYIYFSIEFIPFIKQIDRLDEDMRQKVAPLHLLQ